MVHLHSHVLHDGVDNLDLQPQVVPSQVVNIASWEQKWVKITTETLTQIVVSNIIINIDIFRMPFSIDTNINIFQNLLIDINIFKYGLLYQIFLSVSIFSKSVSLIYWYIDIDIPLYSGIFGRIMQVTSWIKYNFEPTWNRDPVEARHLILVHPQVARILPAPNLLSSSVSKVHRHIHLWHKDDDNFFILSSSSSSPTGGKDWSPSTSLRAQIVSLLPPACLIYWS